MKLIKSFVVASLMLSTVLAYSASPSTSIEVVNSQWMASFNSGHIDGMRSLYTDDAVMFPPSSEILESPTTIISYFDGLKNIGVNVYSISNVSLDIKGKVAYATSLWEAIRVDESGNEFTFEGNLTSVLELQEDGNWKIKLQSWN